MLFRKVGRYLSLMITGLALSTGLYIFPLCLNFPVR